MSAAWLIAVSLALWLALTLVLTAARELTPSERACDCPVCKHERFE